ILAVGEHDALAVQAICMHTHSGVDDKRVAFAVHPYSSAARTRGQQVADLANPVVTAINVQAKSKGCAVVLAMQILRAFCISCKEASVIDDIQATSVYRAPEEVSTIYRVAYVLQ